MARLWSDIVDPAELTGYAREAQSVYETNRGTLARWLPNTYVPDASVRFVPGATGLVEEAQFRAFDAEPEFGSGVTRKRVTVDLPAISQQGLIGERDQMRIRNSSDEVIRDIVEDSAERAVRAVADRIEKMRGQVLVTGKATIDQANFKDETDFGRRADFTTTATALWSDPDADRIGYLETLLDLYREENGAEPGSLVMSSRVMRSLSNGSQFGVQLVGGGTRPATQGDVQAILAGAGLPEIVVFDRRTSSGRVIPDDRLLLLPAAVDVNDSSGTELGGSFWGQTLSASEPEWGIAESEQPGVVAAAFTHEGVPPIRHTYVDAIAYPVLANANLSLCAKVL